ncbi:MAG: FtsX-like permease family protein, partial [Bacteroidota bacterium]
KNLGIEKDHVITFALEGNAKKRIATFIAEINKISGVINASYMEGDLTSRHGGIYHADWEGKRPDQMVDFSNIGIGYDLIETLDIEMKEGRSFSENLNSETSSVIFNESAIKYMGLSQPIGKTISILGSEKEIVGVVKDFHFESLYKSVQPCYFYLTSEANNILVKIEQGTEQATLASLDKVFKVYNQGLPMDYKFLDEDYQKLYISEQRVTRLSQYFAGLAIIISCLGLFGLASFSAERRLKEIGIRKVLGASVFGIIQLLSSDFTKMVLIAILIALPLSYLITQRWLESFAYRIDLAWWYFAGTGILALLIAWITVGLQTVKAANINPVKCLRDE